MSPEEVQTREVLDAVCRELAVAADELNDQQRRAAHFAPSFVFVDHSLHAFSSAAVTFYNATEQPLYQFRQQSVFWDPVENPGDDLVDCTLGTSLRVCHCSGARWFPKRLLFGRGIRWRSRSVYRPDNKGDLATTSVTIMVMEDGSPVFIAEPDSIISGRPRQRTRYSGDLAGWQKLLYETGYAPLVGR